MKPKLTKNFGIVRRCPSCGAIIKDRSTDHTLHCPGCDIWFKVTYYIPEYQ